MNTNRLTDGLTKANALYRAGEYRDALKLYKQVALRPEWARLVRANIELCRKKLRLDSLDESPEIVVALTTIRSRLPYLPKVIGSILGQTLRPTRIDLNISREAYLLDEGIDPYNPTLLDLKNIPLININWVPNTGPYRKIWSFMETHFSQSDVQDKLLVTVDDDTLYPDYFLQRLYENYLQYDCIIAFRGRHISFDQQKLMPYDNWTLGETAPSLQNLPTGKDGVLYSTKFFTQNFLNLADALRLAPTADDLWIKWHCALNGVPSVVLNPEACTSDYKSFPVVNYDRTFRNNSLYSHHNASGAQNKNDVSTKNLEEYFMASYGYNLATLLHAREKLWHRMKHQSVSNSRSDASDMLICLRMGSDVANILAISGHLESWLEIFRCRFSARVVLGIAGFNQLTPKVLALWIGKGVLCRSICSGHDELILNDLVLTAVSLKAQHACFIDVRHLLNNMVSNIRFLVECTKGRRVARIDNSGYALYLSIAQLEQLMHLKLNGPWAKHLREIHRWSHNCAVGGRQDVISDIGVDEPSVHNTIHLHCFATTSGVQRLGGFEKFRDLPLRIGGVPIASFDQYWLLDITTADTDSAPDIPTGPRYSEKRVPAIWASENVGGPVVFDLCPAPHASGSVADDDSMEYIDAPRQVIVGRQCKPLEGTTRPSNQHAVFIASNYNKKRYLYASMYSIVMQIHHSVRIEVVDDVSSDDSVAQVHSFCTKLNLPTGLITLRKNRVSRGTYWIRNDVTAQNLSPDTVLFVNDSDDYSTALRATLQLAALQTRKDSLGCFFDIVRVRPTYDPLLIGGEVERYGTASLCYKSELINRVGYFQNIRKNADTEFIERVRRFEGATALPWLRYPVLYQPFDGGNLTADIYTVQYGENRVDVIKESKRNLHSAIFRRHHEQIRREELPTQFNFPLSALTENYAELGDEFLVDGYRAADDCIVMLASASEVAELDAWLKCDVCVLYRDLDQNWIFHSSQQGKLTYASALSVALLGFSREQAPHAYLVSRSLLSEPRPDMHGVHAVFASLVGSWLYRSKTEGDRWAYTCKGERIEPDGAIALLSEHWHVLQSGMIFDETPVLMHTHIFAK